MQKTVSLGIMEQPIMRQEFITNSQQLKIAEVFENVTHIAGKYFATIPLLKERIKTLGNNKSTVLHAQYLHTDENIINLADPDCKIQLAEDFAKIIDLLEPQLISFHLGFACEKLVAAGQYGAIRSLTPLLSKDVICDRIAENIAFVREKYLKKGSLLLENLDYYPSENCHYEHVCEPEFITEVLQKSNCGMLLDVGHATCSFNNMGHESFMAYCDKLPLEKVIEIHISSTDMQNGMVRDAHRPITGPGNPELGYLEQLLESEKLPNLKLVTLETFNTLLPQLRALRSLLEKYGYSIEPYKSE